MNGYRDAFLEINIDQLINNVKSIKKAVKDTKICAVLKGNAEGMGAKKVAALIDEYVYMYAVAVLDEAIELRDVIKNKSILVLGNIPERFYKAAIENNITFTVYNYDMCKKINEIAAECNLKAKVHIKIETGMNRLGFLISKESASEILEIKKMSNLIVEGIYSHFSCADEADRSYTDMQFSRFIGFLNCLETLGVTFKLRHICSSAGIVNFPEYYLDMVRPGLILTGHYASEEVKKENVPVIPCISFKARLVNIKTVPLGEGISYGKTFVTKKPMVVGTIPAGFSDGFPRSLSNCGYVICKNKKCPILGTICMDQFMIDLTDIENPQIGDMVILYGNGAHGEMTIDEIAAKNNTVVDEILTRIPERVPRIYI